MEKRRKNRCAQVEMQVRRMRRLYSQMGEPLPVDVIIDLHRSLGAAMDLLREVKPETRLSGKTGGRMH